MFASLTIFAGEKVVVEGLDLCDVGMEEDDPGRDKLYPTLGNSTKKQTQSLFIITLWSKKQFVTTQFLFCSQESLGFSTYSTFCTVLN